MELETGGLKATFQDYHIQIHGKHMSSAPHRPIHNLSFSTYRANNRDSDNHLQALYYKTNDNSYVQSLPNGEIFAFLGRTPGKERMDRTLRALQHTNVKRSCSLHPNLTFFFLFSVAIFDILQAPLSIDPPNPQPFALLQPRPRLPDLFPSRSLSAHHLSNLEYVRAQSM